MVQVKHSVSWQKLISLFDSQKGWMLAAFAEIELTPQIAKAIMHIPAVGSCTMSELAYELLCDASNCTGIVDRLEARGFVERRSSPTDRRAKLIVLTAAGKRMRRRIEEIMTETPPAIAALSAADQRAMAELIDRALSIAEAQRLESA